MSRKVEDLIAVAIDDFLKLRQELTLPSGPIEHSLLWQKDDQRRHIVLKVECGGEAYVLKRVFESAQTDLLKEEAQAQLDASEAMGNEGRMRAPKVHHASDDGTLILMEHVEGNTLDALLYKGRSPGSLLMRSGRWLGTFHRLIARKRGEFQPDHMVKHVSRLAAKVEQKQKKIPQPKRFLECAEQIAEFSERFEGQPTLAARRHGDINMRNMIFADQGIFGIDFQPPAMAPVAFDITRLLMDFAEIHQDNRDLAPGKLFLSETVEAFFKGYRLIDASDPAFQFLPHVRLLQDWMTIPAKTSERSWRQQTRWKNIKVLAENGFK